MSDRRVLFFGDSHVAGVGDPRGQGWVGRLAAASFEHGLPITAYNLGVRMETSEQVAARWHGETLPRLVATADCLIVLSFGVNDTTPEDGSPRVPAERSQAALVSILDRVAAMDLRALVIGPAPVADAEQNELIASLSHSFAEVCLSADVSYMPVLEPLLRSPTWMREVSASDGAHPAAAGYETLAGLVLATGWSQWLLNTQG